MITVENVSLQFGGQKLFDKVDLQFTAGNCYGIIGANGAGKSTFLRILSGELTGYDGSVTIDKKRRMSVLKQNQSMYDDYSVMDTVILGNKRLYDIGKEKDAIYEKPDFSDEDGIKAADVRAACEKEGLLVLTAKTRLRLLPPLTLSEHDVDMALEILSDVLGKMEPTAPKEQA